MKLKKRNKRNYYVTIILIILCSWFNIRYIGIKLMPHIKYIVEKNVNKSIYNYVYNIFDKEVLENENMLDIISLNTNSEGEIISVDYKFNIAYKYLSDGMNYLYDNVSKMKINTDFDSVNDGVYFIPVGYTQNNMLLDNLGFKIPCKIMYLSEIDMGFKTRVTDYGMNNVLVELYLNINIKNNLMSPNSFYEFGNTYEMIIASKVVMGRIPSYYGGTIEKSTSIVSS